MFLRVITTLCFISTSGYGFAQAAPGPPKTADDLPRVHLSESAAASHLRKKVNPIYLPNAKQAWIEGDVVLRILIGVDGRVTVLDVVSGSSLRRNAARQAVAQWQYETYDRHGHISEVVTLTPP
ncbi:MAG: energy transducer TonB [Candidatus Sulfotelmatobacter sp.]